MKIKHLNKKNIDVFSMISSGILYMIMGSFFIIKKSTIIFAVKGLLNLLILLLIITGLAQLLGFSLIKKQKLTTISRTLGFLLNMILASLIYFKPQLIISILPISFGIYALISGLVRFLIYLQYKNNQVRGRIFILFGSFFLSLLGLMMVTKPLSYLIPLSNLIGLFFIFYGLTYLIDGLVEGLSLERKNSLKRRIRINLPVFMVAMIPHRVLKEINKALETDSLEEDDFLSHKDNEKYDLEVLIHVGEKAPTAFGHVDIYFDDRILTYGSYDEATYKLKGLISDGVLIEAESKEAYISFSQSYFNKTIFGFGLKLTYEQKENVRQRIESIYNNLYEWKPDSRLAEENRIDPLPKYKDYASIVYDNLKAKFYKFKSGPFKTYFGLNTNCVLLADSIVGQAGIDIIKIQGLITPGAYFDYFNKEFLRKNSFVVSRNIYYNPKSY